MSSTYCARSQEELFSTLVRRLPYIERRNDSRFEPLLSIDKCMHSAGESKASSTLDAISGYLQIELDKQDLEKTAFTSDHGLYRFRGMPFGRSNAPKTFHRAIDDILASVR